MCGCIGRAGNREVTEVVVVVAELLGLPFLGQLAGIEGRRSGQDLVAPSDQDISVKPSAT
jgi:hypothetical protein